MFLLLFCEETHENAVLFSFLMLFHDRASLVKALRCPSKLTVVGKRLSLQSRDATFSVLLQHQGRYVVHTFVLIPLCVHNHDGFFSILLAFISRSALVFQTNQLFLLSIQGRTNSLDHVK